LGDVQGISLGMQDAIWMNRYLKSCLKKAEPYLLSSFPIIGSVVKLKDSKSFIIDQGSKHGISPKQDIVIVRDSIKIAEGKVIEVQSSLSIVKIKKLISVNDLKAGDRIIGKEKYMNIETAIKMLEQ